MTAKWIFFVAVWWATTSTSAQAKLKMLDSSHTSIDTLYAFETPLLCSYRFMNTGNDTLYIQSHQSIHGAESASFFPDKIAPRDTGTATTIFNYHVTGPFERMSYLKTSDGLQTFKRTGYIKEGTPSLSSLAILDFQKDIKSAAKLYVPIRIKNTGSNTLFITKASAKVLSGHSYRIGNIHSIRISAGDTEDLLIPLESTRSFYGPAEIELEIHSNTVTSPNLLKIRIL